MIAKIVFPIPIDKEFDYRIPDNLRDKISIGMRVTAPFGRRSLTGYCVGLAKKSDIPDSRIKEIIRLEDTEPLITKPMLELARWMADYYLCSWGEALDAVLPAGVRRKVKKARAAKYEEDYFTSPVTKTQPFPPTPAQAIAINTILETLKSGKPRTFLLHGITDSGKTEVYLQVIAEAVRQGRQAIVLVPEVSLTPQAVQRFRERFDRVAVLHSYLTERQRAEQWQHIRDGSADVVIGARSAIFAPTPNLGVIVIDDEHEPSFKQESIPRYHAREVALKRSELEKPVVILGSATPSLESFYRAQQGEFKLLSLPERIEVRPLPPVEIVDLTYQAGAEQSMPIISSKLESLIHQSLSAGEQVILFLNRRGYLTLTTCPRCGLILRCRRCQVALTYHKKPDKNICHHCGDETAPPERCPECAYPKLKRLGLGTERVEETIKKMFGGYKVGRMDSDIMRKRANFREALNALWKGQTDILIGTQMIAKGLDFPNVTLVGVISADTALYLKDFRSAERTFQLITQVAGRAGRGPKGGRVIVQTINPAHYSIAAGAQHDYESFARQELTFRKQLFYPPFSYLLKILALGTKEADIEKYLQRLGEGLNKYLKADNGGELLGPAPAPIVRIRGKYRWQIIVKVKSPEVIQKLYNAFQKELSIATKKVTITLDVDPISLL